MNATDQPTVLYDKKNPFPAKLIQREKLTKPGSQKETLHVVLDISGSGLHYTIGDWIGIYPTNCTEDVDNLLHALSLTGDEPITLPKSEDTLPLREALSHRLSIADPSKKFLTWMTDRLTNPIEIAQVEKFLSPEHAEECKEYLKSRHWIDLVLDFPSAEFTPQEFVDHLKKLMPRLYSIASSPKLHPNHIHLAIAVVRYETHGRQRKGVTTTYLTDRACLNKADIPVFISHTHFNLPEDPSKDVIMVGPGTGVAPFRAFLQELDHHKATGRSWLFFGEQRRQHDFLYEKEWDYYLNNKQLTRMDLAFSRDQDHKIYVQDKMKEHAQDLWQWIQNGAYFYVCGDAKRMAKDVEQTLLDIFQNQGNMSPDQAKDYIKQMKKEKRYQRDVY